ncbi:LysR family transcriptional regulator [Hartmannibacter diazotrophicus]|nr:LysR family transcriptional regulator [Hartmannibacter diazotrophicus]
MIQSVQRAGSIRKAAEDMNITASALTRRVLQFEEDFGAPIFERLPRGVRLNAAGELLIQHMRSQEHDLARVRSLVADLSGERRGRVTIACSQALIPYFLPRQISLYRRDHPGVTFKVSVRDRVAAERDLSDFSSDLALVFEPMHLVDFEVLMDVPQPVHAILPADNPLARKSELRLRECLAHTHVIPTAPYGVRHLLDIAAKRRGHELRPIIEAESFELMRHYVLYENAIAFQLPIGLNPESHPRIAIRPISQKDLPAGRLLLGQMRGRALPVASARFAVQLATALEELRDDMAGIA